MEDVPVNGVAQGLAGADRQVILTLYSREYCHLCHDMLALVESMRERFKFELRVIDVDCDPALEERYGDLVPVLIHDHLELARYRLNTPALETYLIGVQIGAD